MLEAKGITSHVKWFMLSLVLRNAYTANASCVSTKRCQSHYLPRDNAWLSKLSHSYHTVMLAADDAYIQA